MGQKLLNPMHEYFGVSAFLWLLGALAALYFG
jgi:hypothetical protein